MADKEKKMGPKEILSGGGEKKKEPKGKGGKHKFGETRIKHHKNGSHTVEHVPESDGTTPPGPSTSYAVSDLQGVHDGLDQNVGGGESEEAAGGAPPPAAAPVAG